MRRLLVLLAALLAALVVAAPSALAADKDCKDFPSQAAAQAYFDAHGGSPSNNVDNLDADHDGQACETYPYGTANQQPATATGGTLARTGEHDSLYLLAGVLLALGGVTLLATRYRPHHVRR